MLDADQGKSELNYAYRLNDEITKYAIIETTLKRKQ